MLGAPCRLQFGDGKTKGNVGGLALFTHEGRFSRFASSMDPAFPGARIRTYSLDVSATSDRVITTSAVHRLRRVRPHKPRRATTLTTDSTFAPHWMSRDVGSNRIVRSAEGAHPSVRIVRFDLTTGRAQPHGAVFSRAGKGFD